MEIISISITLIALIVTVVFGYLQIVVPFIKKEVRFSKRFPYIEPTDVPRKRRKRRRPRRRWVIPVSAVAVVIIAIVLFRILLLQAAELPCKPIAVMTFKNLTGDASYDYLCKAIPNLLITNLEQSERLQIMTWERMHDLLKQLDKDDLAVIDEETGFELCRMDDVTTIVTGSFTRAGNMFVTEVKILDVSSKKLLKTASSKGEGVASILKIQIDKLSRDIANSVSLYERVAAPTELQVMEVTTTSMEAYNYFLRGREDYEKLYYDDARKFLEKAVEIDPTFAAAYLYLYGVYFYLGDSKASYDAIKKAKAFSDKTTDKERLYIDADYASGVEKNREKKSRILEQLVRKYPNEKRAHVMLAVQYNLEGSVHRVIEELHKALELDPSYGEALNELAYRYAAIGDYATAIEYFKRYAAVSPGDANPFDSMGDLYFRMGKLDEALVQYKEALFVKPNFGASSGNIAYIYALKEDYAEAMKWVDYLIAIAPSSGTRADGYWQKAFYNYLLGNLNRTLNNLETVEDLLEPIEYEFGMAFVNWIWTWIYYDQGKLQLSRDHLNDCYANLGGISASYTAIFYNFYLGLIDLKQENLDSAKAKLAAIEPLLADIEPYFNDRALFLHDLLYAEVLLAQDSIEKSIAIGERASKFAVEQPPGWSFSGRHILCDQDVMARAYIKKGDVDRAIIEYERLTDPDPNKRGRYLIRPTWHYKCAKLYEEKGQKAKAIEQYEKFLDIWMDADADRPELIDAKKQLARLKATG